MIYVYPYRRGSRSALALARALGGRRLRFGETERIPEGSVVINWGASQCPYPNALNYAADVTRASNKLHCFRILSAARVPIPEFAASRSDVTWHGLTVVRHKLTGHSGDGIELCETEKGLPDARLYVKYVKKQNEYRVHVIGQEVILVQRKARRLDVPDSAINWRVRNHSNGFVFVRQDVNPSEAVRTAALDAVRYLGLVFGAVDIIEKKDGTVMVLEINTAPGMEGSTANDYAEGFRRHLSSLSAKNGIL